MMSELDDYDYASRLKRLPTYDRNKTRRQNKIKITQVELDEDEMSEAEGIIVDNERDESSDE